MLPRDELVQADAEAVHVCLLRESSLHSASGINPSRIQPQHLLALEHRRHASSVAEIGQLRNHARRGQRGEQNVGSLEITEDDVAVVQILHARGNILGDRQQQRPAPLLSQNRRIVAPILCKNEYKSPSSARSSTRLSEVASTPTSDTMLG